MTPRAKIDVKREIVQTMVEDLASGKYFLPSFSVSSCGTKTTLETSSIR